MFCCILLHDIRQLGIIDIDTVLIEYGHIKGIVNFQVINELVFVCPVSSRIACECKRKAALSENHKLVCILVGIISIYLVYVGDKIVAYIARPVAARSGLAYRERKVSPGRNGSTEHRRQTEIIVYG